MTSHFGSKSIAPGTILAGKYRVERKLGEGGMGTVFAVRHLELQEDFAIKLMQGREFSNPKAIERFLREARAAVRLRSKTEHIVQVHDVGRIESGEPYIVMELLSGQDLSDLLVKRGVLPIAEACSFIMQAGHALEAAHQLGIIHRDLKPANLFHTRRQDGSPCIKVLDFGISKHVATGDDSEAIEITGTQDVMGSPLYMSPELAKAARNATPRSDIWALGAILYKLLTGRAPFQAASPAEVFAELLGPSPAAKPSKFREDVPTALDEIILKCIEKNPLSRYETITSFLADLAPFTRSLPIPATESTSAPPQLSPSPQDQQASPAPKSRLRRPSLIEALPVGFALQPPPAPPTLLPIHDSITAAQTPPEQLGANSRSALSPLTLAPTHPAATDRPILSLPTSEATGSTWGTTQSRLATPRQLRNGLLAGLAGTLILILAMTTAGILSSSPSSSDLNSAETTAYSPPSIDESRVSPEIRAIEPLLTAQTMPPPTELVPSLGSASATASAVASSAAKPPIIPHRAVQKPQRGKSAFENYH